MNSDVLYSASHKFRKRKVRAAAKMESDVSNGATGDSFQMQALEIREPGADFDPDANPANGEEYLMHMLYERMQCPAVVVRRPKQCTESPNHAIVETTGVQQQMGASNVGITILPTAEWKLVQATDFQATRDHIAQIRQVLVEQKYDNKLELPLTTDSEEWQKFCREQKPLLTTILRLSQRTLEQLLEMLCEWLQCGEMVVEQETVQYNLSVSALDLFSSDQWLGTWLYAALACLHLPLEPQVHSTLRDIARSCIRLRSRLLKQDLEKAAPYNLFIFLIAQVFGQLDFAEFV